ncbi:hypothetical protein HK097_010388, partial [Rhizophlyctis rosea]
MPGLLSTVSGTAPPGFENNKTLITDALLSHPKAAQQRRLNFSENPKDLLMDSLRGRLMAGAIGGRASGGSGGATPKSHGTSSAPSRMPSTPSTPATARSMSPVTSGRSTETGIESAANGMKKRKRRRNKKKRKDGGDGVKVRKMDGEFEGEGGKSGSQDKLLGSLPNLGISLKELGGVTTATQETALASSFRNVMDGSVRSLAESRSDVKDVGGATAATQATAQINGVVNGSGKVASPTSHSDNRHVPHYKPSEHGGLTKTGEPDRRTKGNKTQSPAKSGSAVKTNGIHGKGDMQAGQDQVTGSLGVGTGGGTVKQQVAALNAGVGKSSGSGSKVNGTDAAAELKGVGAGNVKERMEHLLESVKAGANGTGLDGKSIVAEAGVEGKVREQVNAFEREEKKKGGPSGQNGKGVSGAGKEKLRAEVARALEVNVDGVVGGAASGEDVMKKNRKKDAKSLCGGGSKTPSRATTPTPSLKPSSEPASVHGPSSVERFSHPLPLELSRNEKLGRGLWNEDIYCYMNSVLQALMATPPLRKYVELGIHQRKCSLPSKSCHLCVFGELLTECKRRVGGAEDIKSQVAVYMNTDVDKKGRRIVGMADANEFFNNYMRHLEQDAERTCGSNGALRSHAQQETGPFYSIFGYQEHTEIRCLSCGNVQGPSNPGIGLTVNITDSNRLVDGLRGYAEPEKLDDKILCERCETHRFVTRRSIISDPPPILAILLGRTRTVYSPRAKDWIPEKIEKRYDFDMTLDLGVVCVPGTPMTKYSLYAVVVHSGAYVWSGHYVAYVKDAAGVWWKYDDDTVRKSSADHVLRMEAYMLFYSRIGFDDTEDVRRRGKTVLKEAQRVGVQLGEGAVVGGVGAGSKNGSGFSAGKVDKKRKSTSDVESGSFSESTGGEGKKSKKKRRKSGEGGATLKDVSGVADRGGVDVTIGGKRKAGHLDAEDAGVRVDRKIVKRAKSVGAGRVPSVAPDVAVGSGSATSSSEGGEGEGVRNLIPVDAPEVIERETAARVLTGHSEDVGEEKEMLVGLAGGHSVNEGLRGSVRPDVGVESVAMLKNSIVPTPKLSSAADVDLNADATRNANQLPLGVRRTGNASCKNTLFNTSNNPIYGLEVEGWGGGLEEHLKG